VVSLAYELWHLVAATVLGVALGLVLDLGRALERGFGLSGILLQVADLCTWLVGALVFFYGAYVLIGFSLRFYVALGAAAGLCLYYLLASPALLPAASAFFRGVLWLVRWPGRALPRGRKK
jgi:spore cortex biosynthesis protein YabQ